MSYVIFIRCRIYRQPLHTNVCVYKHQRERQASSLLFYIQPVDRNNRINNGHLRRACLSMYSFVASPHLFFRRYQSKLPLFCCVCHPAQKDSLVGPLRSFFSKPHTHRNRVHPIQNKKKINKYKRFSISTDGGGGRLFKRFWSKLIADGLLHSDFPPLLCIYIGVLDCCLAVRGNNRLLV